MGIKMARYESVRMLIPILAEKYNLQENAETALRLLEESGSYDVLILCGDYETAMAFLHLPKIIKDPSEYFLVQDPCMRKVIKRVALKLGLNLVDMKRASEIARKFGEPEDVVKRIEEFEKTLKLPQAGWRVKTATLAYLAYVSLGKKIYKKDIAERYDVTETSIRLYIYKIRRLNKSFSVTETERTTEIDCRNCVLYEEMSGYCISLIKKIEDPTRPLCNGEKFIKRGT
jgi:hypothetical protein